MLDKTDEGLYSLHVVFSSGLQPVLDNTTDPEILVLFLDIGAIG